jgi:hypothetical protein
MPEPKSDCELCRKPVPYTRCYFRGKGPLCVECFEFLRGEPLDKPVKFKARLDLVGVN